MEKNQRSNKRKCAFYVSEYHCDLIMLNYIKEKRAKNFIIFTENNQKNNIKKITDVLNFNNEDKNNLLNCNWDNDKYINIQRINDSIINDQSLSIFIQGSKKYIKDTNESITNMVNKHKNCEVIDFYEFDEVFLDINNLSEKYSTALNISAF